MLVYRWSIVYDYIYVDFNQAKNHLEVKILLWLIDMHIHVTCEHVHRLELQKFWLASVMKTLCISYFVISYFGHACLKLYLVVFLF